MLNEQIVAKRAIARRRYERRYARHKPAPIKARRVAAPIEPLPGGGYKPRWRPSFSWEKLMDIFTTVSPPPKPKRYVDAMGAPGLIEFVDPKGRKLLKDVLAYVSRSKYQPHQGGGQYQAARQGRRGHQS